MKNKMNKNILILLAIVLVIAGFVVASKGLIDITEGATPFYTNASTNPLTTSSLSEGQSELITFWVNATGMPDNTYEFFAYANTTSDLSISAITVTWNVTIKDSINPDINFTNPTKANGTSVSQDYIFVNVSVTDTNEDKVVFELFNSDHSLFKSRIHLSELPDAQATSNGINMTGNVLLMHFNNDSSVGEIYNNSNGTVVYDYSGNLNNGTGYFGADGDGVWNSSGGKFSGAFEFDGVDDYVDAGSALIPTTGDFTLFAWMKTSITNNPLITQYNSDKNGRLTFYATSGDYNGKSSLNIIGATPSQNVLVGDNALNDGIWHQLAVTRASTDFRLYVDGVLEDNSTTTVTIDNYKNTFIGFQEQYYSSYFNGTIDEVAIWNRSLSALEIQEIYEIQGQKYYHNFTGLSDGTYYYNVTANDTLGNKNSTETRQIDIISSVSSNKFTITNSSNNNVASIDDKGDMYLKGTALQSQGLLSPTLNSFIIRNSSADNVAYFNNTGSLFLFGSISTSSDLSGMTSTNLEFRNSTNDLVGFFDNLGNLKLRGYFVEGYANP